jgi:carboxymethylenebutenolidase
MTRRIDLSKGDGLDGALFLPDAERPVPAVVILHERYGLAQHTLDLARRFADDGYVALAPDLFSRWEGDKAALARGDVRVTLPDDEVADMIDASLARIGREAGADRDKVALMGVCQSGRYPIVAASRGTKLAASVVLYGAAQAREWEVTTEQPRALADMIAATREPSLWIFGEGDHVISVDDVLRVRGALEAARRAYRMRIFAGAPHGWLNDTMPGRFRPRLAAEAWTIIHAFLADAFERGWPNGRVRWEFSGDIAHDYDFRKNIRLE